jgi:hypothetical protein
MAIIETNWDIQKKDLRVFAAIGAIVFGILAVGKIAEVGAIVRFADRLLSWQLLAAGAVLSVIGATLKSVPQRQKKYGILGAILLATLAFLFYAQVVGPHRWIFVALAAFFVLGVLGGFELIRPVYSMALVATFPIGLVVGPIIMAVMFYVIFLPVGLIFKLIGRDTMTRRFDDAAASYWIPRRPTTDVKRYFRQF